MKLNRKQSLAMDYIDDNVTNDLLYGGAAGGGKSVLGCYYVLKGAFKYPGTRWLMGRAKLKTLKETTLVSFFKVAQMQNLIHNKHYKLNGSNSNENPNSIELFNKSIILLKDLYYYPSDPFFDELGSLEITGAFIDECNQITERAWNTVRSRIRHNLDENNLIPKILGTCNPAKNYVYNKFYKPNRDKILPSNVKFIPALVTDNQFISKHYAESLNGLDAKSKERLLYGNWEYDDDPTVLMDYEKIVDLFTNNFVGGGQKFITADVARLGNDSTKIRVWDGLRSIHKVTLNKTRIDELITVIRKLQVNFNVPNQNTILDEDGVGGGAVDGLRCKGFVNNSRPLPVNGVIPNIENLRAQCYLKLAEIVNTNQMYLSDSDIKEKEIIIQELEQIKQIDIDNDAKIKIIRRDDIIKNIGHSPDEASCLMMRMYFELYKPQPFKPSRVL